MKKLLFILTLCITVTGFAQTKPEAKEKPKPKVVGLSDEGKAKVAEIKKAMESLSRAKEQVAFIEQSIQKDIQILEANERIIAMKNGCDACAEYVLTDEALVPPKPKEKSETPDKK